ncbi:MAG: hypothetical protein IH944_13760 [Armatimonadetes bacterium]|nr:hypothetical protein [Armatimonadota bacterium]
MGQEPISPVYRDKLIQDLKDKKHEYDVMIHREKDKAKDILHIEQDMRDIINGIKTDRSLDERETALRVTNDVMREADIRAKQLVIEIEETMAELSRVELDLANVEALKKIAGYNKDTRDAINQGKLTNRIMVAIAVFMAVMAFFTLLNSISIREQAENPVVENIAEQDPTQEEAESQE